MFFILVYFKRDGIFMDFGRTKAYRKPTINFEVRKIELAFTQNSQFLCEHSQINVFSLSFYMQKFRVETYIKFSPVLAWINLKLLLYIHYFLNSLYTSVWQNLDSTNVRGSGQKEWGQWTESGCSGIEVALFFKSHDYWI